MRQLFYYKMRQTFITKCVRLFTTKCDSFITKCDSYYKMRRLLQIATVHYILGKTTELTVNDMFYSRFKFKVSFLFRSFSACGLDLPVRNNR